MKAIQTARNTALAVAIWACGVHCAQATCGVCPHSVLEKGGNPVETAPEFFWADLVTDMCVAFKPREKPVVPTQKKAVPAAEKPDGDYSPRKIPGEDSTQEEREKFTAAIDLQDFNDALKTGRLVVGNKDEARDNHIKAREMIDKIRENPKAPDSGADPDEAAGLVLQGDSEFARYNRGAFAFHKGDRETAAREWKALLEMPSKKRFYRSTWAAYMLGRAALESRDPAEAIKWFRRARELAQLGFKDSLGLAAESYGWEAKSELALGHKDQAAKLYLTQLALGDDSAIESLKKCLPLKLGDAESYLGESECRYFDADALAGAALDPVRRNLITAFILSNLPSHDYLPSHTSYSKYVDCSEWLEILKKLNLGKVEYAEWVAWIAYANGDYEEAKNWLEVAPADEPRAMWLRAKLAVRSGNFELAAQSFEQLLKTDFAASTDPSKNKKYGKYACAASNMLDSPIFDPSQIRTEFACILLALGRIGEAEKYFEQGQDDLSAAYIRESLFALQDHLDWLKARKRVPASDLLHTWADQFGEYGDYCGGLPGKEEIEKRRLALLEENKLEVGRRLVRMGRFSDAANYFSPEGKEALGRYTKNLKAAYEPQAEAAELAFRKFAAARFMWSMLISAIGNEYVESQRPNILSPTSFPNPDLYCKARSYRCLDIEGERRSGKFFSEFADGGPKWFDDFVIPVGRTEKILLRSTGNTGKMQCHVGKEVDLLLEAAALLPDQSAEQTDALETAISIAGQMQDLSGELKKVQIRNFIKKRRPDLLDSEGNIVSAMQEHCYWGWPEGPLNKRFVAEFPPSDS